MEEDERNDYEVTSMKETPCVANSIIRPQQYMTFQVANLAERTIMIHKNQPLATMTRLNQAQVNIVQLGRTSSLPKQTASKIENKVNLTNTDLDEYQTDEIKQVIRKFPDVFNEQSGRTGKVQHQINLVPGAQPFNSPPFRYAPARKQIIEQNTKEMLDQGIISPSTSPWASPVILVPKKDGNLRFYINYPKVNSVTIRDA